MSNWQEEKITVKPTTQLFDQVCMYDTGNPRLLKLALIANK
jgi:hypothetical protein